MTPNEKAKELFNKFDQNVVSTNYSHMSKDSVKQCAIIAVDELIEAFMELSRQESGRVYIDFGHGYWQEVKSELEKL